jgi:hypothetical protein
MDGDPSSPTYAIRALEQLNRYVDGNQAAPVIITCRSQTYASIARLHRLQDAATLELQPVLPDEVDSYIASRSANTGRWATVIAHLRSGTNSPCARALRNAWLLSLAFDLYESNSGPAASGSPDDLLGYTSDAALADHLVSGFVLGRLRRSGRFGTVLERWRYDEKRCLRALKSFADYLDLNAAQNRHLGGLRLGGTDLVLHELWPLAGNRRVRYSDLTLSFVMSLPGLLWIVWYAMRLPVWTHPLFALFFLLYAIALVRTSTSYWIKPTHFDFRQLLTLRSLPQTLFALIVATVLALGFNPVVGVAGGAVAWLVSGLSIGIMQGLVRPPEKALDPRDPLRRDRRVSLLAGLTVAPLTALAFGQFGGLPGLIAGALYALVVGLTVASAPWRRYVVFVALAPRGVPWRPSAFLAWVHRIDVLRVSGISYQFRHLALQDWLARMPSP